MSLTIDNAVILMGQDNYNPKKTLADFHKDGEVYLNFINKNEVALFGKTIQDRYFDRVDESTLLPMHVIVIAPREYKDEISANLVHRKKKYIIVEQPQVGFFKKKPANRFRNLRCLQEEFGLQGNTYVSGADLPQATSIDERLQEIQSQTDGTYHAANILFGNITALRSFWRKPFFLKDSGYLTNNHLTEEIYGFKESQDYILQLDKVSAKRMDRLKPGTKLSNPLTIAKLFIAGAPLLVSRQGIYVPGLAINGVKTINAAKEYHKKPIQFSWPTDAADSKQMLDQIARLFAGITNGIEDATLKTSNRSEFYKDLDSMQDAYRHAMELWKLANPGKYTTFESLSDHITYHGKRLIDLPEIAMFYSDISEFFGDIRMKEYKMREFTSQETR